MEEFLKNITCSGTECLCWILVLFNILAVFYLVFCSFWKVTRIVKITGWVFSAGLLCATIGILIAHTCIYTLLMTVFTCMMIMAILAVVLPQPNANAEDEKESNKKVKLGAYVISKTNDNRYVFALYDNVRRLIVNSQYSYASIETTKQEICVCRNNGMKAAINDKTGVWIQEEQYPTFEMYVDGGQYRFCLKINGEYMIFASNGFDELRSCEKILEKAKQAVASTDVYLNTEIVNGKDYLHFDNETNDAPLSLIEEIVPSATPIEEESVGENIIAEVAVTATEEIGDDNVLNETETVEGVIGGVAFNRDMKTLWTKYAELSEEQRRYFDAISNYANGKDDVKCIESKDYLTFKYGKDKVVRLRIRKDMTEAVFMLVASAFKQSFTENELKVKEAATIIRVENDAYLDGVIKTIDMQYDALIEERRVRKEAQREKRRQARRNKTGN